MYAIGVSPVSSGGDIVFRHGMMKSGNYVVAKTEEEALDFIQEPEA